MLVFGGIPDIYFDRLKEIGLKRLDNIPFTGIGLRSVNGKYTVDLEYCEELIETLASYCESRPESISEGLGVVMLQRPWETRSFKDCFWPFSLYKQAIMDTKLSQKGEGRKKTANIYVNRAIDTGIKLHKYARKLTTFYKSELRRTPLLLPARAFSSQALVNLLRTVHDTVQDSGSSDVAASYADKKFFASHEKRSDGKGFVFVDNSGIRFKSPPRNTFHGHRPTKANENGHNARCFISSRVRLGGYYEDGFHYDCTRGSRLDGSFYNCHDECSRYRGDPHLNIFPNDFIKG
jgi:hypothetical protein